MRFVGYLDDRHRLAAILACADVAIAPGPVETFRLAALEALASGTPAVVNAASGHRCDRRQGWPAEPYAVTRAPARAATMLRATTPMSDWSVNTPSTPASR